MPAEEQEMDSRSCQLSDAMFPPYDLAQEVHPPPNNLPAWCSEVSDDISQILDAIRFMRDKMHECIMMATTETQTVPAKPLLRLKKLRV